jgi:hypothetical protein
MSKLLIQQQYFQQYLLNESDTIFDMVVGTEKLSAALRLKIYSDAYRIRLIDALRSNYPVLCAYLGADNFDVLAHGYIEQHPSLFRSIRWYGDKLSEFIQTRYAAYPYLEELAKFEWCMTLSFDAVDEMTVSVNDIAQVPADQWGDMRFKIHPAVFRLNLHWNVVAIWEAISNNEPPPEATVTSETSNWIIWRNNYINHFALLARDEACALDALMRGASFCDICAGLCLWFLEDEVGVRAASLLKSWIQAGLITHILLTEDEFNE